MIYAIKNKEGKIIGTTNDSDKGVVISLDSTEYKKYEFDLTVRSKRDNLLKKTDWIDLPNSPVKNKEAWLAYRQALRDLPQNFKNPSEVIWPEKPQ